VFDGYQDSEKNWLDCLKDWEIQVEQTIVD
jgi:hypothetical protein